MPVHSVSLGGEVEEEERKIVEVSLHWLTSLSSFIFFKQVFKTSYLLTFFFVRLNKFLRHRRKFIFRPVVRAPLCVLCRACSAVRALPCVR